MAQPNITCPQCGAAFRLDESLAGPLLAEERRRAAKLAAEQQHEFARREKEIRDEEAARAARKAADDIERLRRDLADLAQLLKDRETKLAAAQQEQAETVRKQRELDEKLREADLTVEKRVAAESGKLREQAQREAADEARLKLREKDEAIISMQKTIAELKRKAEQGSQQLQGEVQELDLEAALRAAFPHDTIAAVPKGQHGGDILQTVVLPGGQLAGKILWESKNTKNWSAGWLAKLRDDQRAAAADLAVLVSRSLPPELNSFAELDRVWVSAVETAVPLATALRHALLATALERLSSRGQETKAALIYDYVRGNQFRQRIEALVEYLTALRRDLEAERQSFEKIWARRYKQIDAAAMATVGLWGDVTGIAAGDVAELDALDIKTLAAVPATVTSK